MKRWGSTGAALAFALTLALLLAAGWGPARARREAAALPFRDRFAASGLAGWQPLGG